MKASVSLAKQATLEREREDMEYQLNRKREELAVQTSAAVNYKKSLDGMHSIGHPFLRSPLLDV